MTLLNCDMGESYGIWRLGDDRHIMPAIHIANVACGFHASDFNHMRATVQLAKAYAVQVGAHPSLPDRQGFGRREMKIGREELANCLIYQIGALKGFLEAEGMRLASPPKVPAVQRKSLKQDRAASMPDAVWLVSRHRPD